MTDTLDRINTVLGGWEAQPAVDEDGWLPGDPLYQRPRGYLAGEQTIRPMFDLIDEYIDPPRCAECDVYWRGPAACFICGQKVPDPRDSSASAYGFLTFADVEVPTARAAASFSSQMRLVAEAFGRNVDDLASRLLVLPNPPANPAAPTVAELNDAITLNTGVLYASLHSNDPSTLEAPEGWTEIGSGHYACTHSMTWAPAAGARITEFGIFSAADPLEPTERPDQRWDKVHAQALRHPATNQVELRIEAGINDRRYGSRSVVDEAELARDPSLYGQTLDKMIEHIEAQARRRQQASPSAPPPSTNPRSRR